jgi:type II secretion system protein H
VEQLRSDRASIADVTRRRRALGRPRGFSLIELLLVIATVALMSAIAVPRWAGATQRYEVDLAAKRIASDLSLARARANYTSTPVTVTFDTNGNGYQIGGMPDLDHPTATYTVSLAAAPYRAALAKVSFGGAAQVTFDGYGTPSQGGTVIVTVSGWSRTITLDAATGSTSVQ